MNNDEFEKRLSKIRQEHISKAPNELTICIENSINTDFKSHNYLSKLANKILNSKCKTITIDMSKLKFVAANQFAILGCIFDTYVKNNNTLKLLTNISPDIMSLMCRNGFGKFFTLQPIPDINNTTIPFKRFNVNEITEYELYLTMKLFARNDLPAMSDEVSNNIRDYLLEIFKNVNDHTNSPYVYTCGQFFPATSLLYFSIVDTGETISYNVTEYFNKYSLPLPSNTLKWAIEAGNTTLVEDAPRGLGLSLIKDFIHENKGYLYIVSGQETYQITPFKENYRFMDTEFPGTIVTIAFNLADSSSYYMKSEIPTIQF